MCLCGSNLCVDQNIVEQDEPVDGEPASILQGQTFVAALADQPPVRLPQRVLTTNKDANRHYGASHNTLGLNVEGLVRAMIQKMRTESLPSFFQERSSRSEQCSRPLSFFASVARPKLQTWSSCPEASDTQSNTKNPQKQTNKKK